MSLKNKRILITAGPTWVPIDRVRVISNIAAGETGILLAGQLQRLGAKITLVLGPVKQDYHCGKIRLLRFRFFDELKSAIERELKLRRYDIVIHSAAVSDYRPKINYRQKIKSGIKEFRLALIPTEKIIDKIKKLQRRVFLVGFKFEPAAAKNVLIDEVKHLMRNSGADLVVANNANGNKYLAYIVTQKEIYGPLKSKNMLAQSLIRAIAKKYG